ncbi:MAG: FAD:protein FMN transferase [Fimbriimonadaceae bacterium]|nr:FAD:protein FMN transferase [Alphaproteobacteria bacterium]
MSRRRFVSLSAAGLGLAAGGLIFDHSNAGAYQAPTIWRGSALGAAAQIQLYHEDPEFAGEQIQVCRREITRLENQFSLYREDSAISRLNRQGFLENPSIEMIALMSRAISFSALTHGAFDVTIQPLWQLYVDHFSREPADPAGPSDEQIAETLKLVGSDKIDLSMQRISFADKAMGISLNGVAQGFITEHVCDILRRTGFENALVHLGETQTLGSHPDGRAWMVGIPVPAGDGDLLTTVALRDQALATSGGYGSPLSSDGKHHHLLDPRTGRSANLYQSVSVIAPGATNADMLSTAIAILPLEETATLLANFAGTQAIILTNEHQVIRL